MKQQKRNLSIKILTQGIEIIERRPKRNNICKEHWWNDDNEIMGDMVQNVGCKLKHWDTYMQAPNCQSQQDYESLRFPPISVVDAGFLKKHVPPCREIQTLVSSNTINDHEPDSGQTSNEPHTVLKVQFKSTTYKMIRNVRAFNEESLVGNLGGYVGLFLGVAFWQAPVFAAQCVNKLQNFKNVFNR